MLVTVPQNSPNVTLTYAFSGVEVSDESSPSPERVFAPKMNELENKRRKCFHRKKPGHKEFKCRKKKADEEREHVA